MSLCMKQRLREALLLTLVGPSLILAGVLLMRHAARAQGAAVPASEVQKAALVRPANTIACNYPGCTAPAVWKRSIGGGAPLFWCEKHLESTQSSGTIGILGLVLILPGIAGTINAFGAWYRVVRGKD